MQHSMMQPAASSASAALAQPGNLRALIETKQHELAVIADYQSRSLAADNATLTQALSSAQQRYEQLKSDFQYNLELLSARDQELARYDALSVEYARTLSSKTDESSERARQLEHRLEARSMELANAEETAAALRQRVSALEESLASATWNAESERRAIESNAAARLKQLEAQLRDKDEAQSKTQYELLFNFERGVHEKSAEAQRVQEALERELRQTKTELEHSREETKRSEDKLKIETHRRQTIEQRLHDADEKLVSAESARTDLQAQVLRERNERALADQESNAAHEALLSNCVRDYKALVTQVEKMQAAALAQTEQHDEATAKAKREAERQANEIQQAYTKQLHAVEQELQLTQQQLADARTLASSVTAELNGVVAADASRSSTLQAHLSEFQASHAKTVADLHASLWKAEEEKKALAESKDACKKHLEDRRAELASAKEKAAEMQGRLDEMERQATTTRLKHERELEDKEDESLSLKAQIKAGQESLKSVQVALESQIARATDAQALAEEYERQLRHAREDLMALARGEEEQIERRAAGGAGGAGGVDPAVQQQLAQMGAELHNMSSHLRSGSKGGLPPPHPSANMLAIPSSARSLAQQQRSGNTTPPEDAHRRVGSSGGLRQAHSPRPYTPAFSDDMGPASLPGSMPTSPAPVKSSGQSILKPSSSSGLRSEPSPTRVVVEAPLLSVMSDSHNALEVEAVGGARRSKASRKQSITSPNINLNHGQSSLEDNVRPESIQEHKDSGSSGRGRGGRRQAQGGGGVMSSGSEGDFVEQAMEDSSGSDHDGQQQQQRQQAHHQRGSKSGSSGSAPQQHRVVMPLHISHEDGMDGMQAELVDEDGQQQQQPQQAQYHRGSGAGSRELSPRASVHSSSSTHDDSTSSADVDRALRRLRKENDALSAQNQGLSGIIRQMKKELEQLMMDQAAQASANAQQASQRAAAQESQRIQALEAALAAKTKELADLASTPQPPLHPFYAPQFPPPPSSYAQSPLGYGPIPPLPMYPPYHQAHSLPGGAAPGSSSFEAAHALQVGQEYLLKSGADKDRARRERERREEEAAGAAAAQAATKEFDRRYEEHKENAAAAAAASVPSARIHSASARIRRSSPHSGGVGFDDDIELSLHGSGVLAHVVGGSASGKREVAFHSSDRSTESQRSVARAIRVRAEIHRKKEDSIKARADAARAKVREQMRRNKSVEEDRQRAAAADDSEG